MSWINSIYNINLWSLNYGWSIAKALVVFLFGIWAINKICKVCDVFLGKSSLDLGSISLISSCIKIFLRGILILLLFSVLGINISSVITAISAFVVTAGILLKDSLVNFVSGIFVIVNKPIRVGDYLELENVKGKVSKIDIIFTTLLTEEKKTIIIPNFKLLSTNILRDSPYDICNFSYTAQIKGEKWDKDVKKILSSAILSNHYLEKIPSPKIDYISISGEKMDIKIEFFCEKRYLDMARKELFESISSDLRKIGLELIIDDWKFS